MKINASFLCSKPKPLQVKMGDLPALRISQAEAFLHTGVDFGGPSNISRHRAVKSSKAYICLFVRLSALHLELACDLTTQTFISAPKRLFAQQGRCAALYSDCATKKIKI